MSIEPDVPSKVPDMGSVPYDPPAEPRGQMDGAPPPAAPDHSKSGVLLSTMYRMWDVDTEDVLSRCKLALNPMLRTPFLTNGLLDAEHATAPDSIVNGKQPDLWGPVWIFLTMVFAVFFSATTSGLLNGFQGSYNAGLLTGTAGTLFAFTFVVPLGAWLAIQYLDLVPTLTLLQTVCLYGYSCTSWIPAVILAGSPLGASAIVGSVVANLVRGVSILLAFLLSVHFVYGNLYKVMSSQASQSVAINKTRMAIVLAAGAVIHAALAITVLLLTSFASKEIKAAPS